MMWRSWQTSGRLNPDQFCPSSYFKSKVETLKKKTNPNIKHAMRYTRRYMMDKTHLFEDDFTLTLLLSFGNVNVIDVKLVVLRSQRRSSTSPAHVK